MVIFAGSENWIPGPIVFRDDVWELSLTGRQRWTERSPSGATPAGRLFQAAAYDPSQDRMLLGTASGLWALQRGPDRPGPDLSIESDWRSAGLGHARPVDLLREGAPSDLDELRIYDVQGRLVLSQKVADAQHWLDALTAGAGREADQLGIGVYFAQKRGCPGSPEWTRRVVLSR